MPTAVVPAAGRGTRFLPATKSISKEMLPLWDRPVISYVVEELTSAGFDRILLVVSEGKDDIIHYLTEADIELENHLQQKGKHDLLNAVQQAVPKCKIEIIEQDQPLGLGHAVHCCAPALANESTFAVALPDVVLLPTADGANLMKQMWQMAQTNDSQVVAVSAITSDETSKYGVPDLGESFTVIGNSSVQAWKVAQVDEKPGPEKAKSLYGLVGRYVLRSEALDELAKGQRTVGGEIQLAEGIDATTPGQLLAVEVQAQVHDCGTPAGLLKATTVLGQLGQGC